MKITGGKNYFWRLCKESCALCLFCLMSSHRNIGQAVAGDTAGRSAGSQASASMKKCIGPTFDDQGAISITSRCTEPVEATWFFGEARQGFAALAPGESVSTGVNASEIPRLGGLNFFACPADHPVFRDPKGNIMTSPAIDYSCGSAIKTASDPKAPRRFTYPLLTSGDCVLERGSLTLNPNGKGEWVARIHTNHTTNRDIWHVNFEVIDSKGRPLFPISVGDSPAMYGSPSPTIPWSILFKFEPTRFRDIADLDVKISC